jgi:hypothetical protein
LQLLLNYTRPVSHFPNPIGPYTPRHLASPNLANTGRIDQLMHDGKLYLSLNDAIALALENNLDIAIARYNLNIADTDILRARAGAQTLGVNTGIVQNTPGSGVGGLGGQVGSGTGGTSLGASGAGAGAGGLVGSTLGLGSLITSFDPILPGRCRKIISDPGNQLFQGVPASKLAQNTGTVNFTYQQGFQWGTNLTGGLQQHSCHSNASFKLSPLAQLGFQVPAHAASVTGALALRPTHASSVLQRTTVNFRRGFPPAGDYDGEPDSDHVLGSGLRLRKCSGAKRVAGFRRQDTLRYQEASGDRQPGADRNCPCPKYPCPGPASLDDCSNQPAVTAVAHEERAQPHPARPDSGGS